MLSRVHAWRRFPLVCRCVEAGVFAEAFGHHDSLRCLVVFEQGGHNAGQSQGRAVEGVAETGFLVGIAVTAFEAVGLIGLKV